MTDEELKKFLKTDYPKIDNKCDEVYKKCVNNKRKFYWNNKLLFIPCATIMLVIIMLIIILDLPGSNKFTELCDGVYVSASSLDLDGKIDMSICEGIVLEKQEFVRVCYDEISPFILNMGWNGSPMTLFFDDDIVFKIYCSEGYVKRSAPGIKEGMIEPIDGFEEAHISWGPFKTYYEEVSISHNIRKYKRILEKCDNTNLYILSIKNDLIIGIAVVHFDIDYDMDNQYNYCIKGKVKVSYVFKDEDMNLKGITEKQLSTIISKLKKKGEI